jgi:hypothetical protein
MNFRIIEKTNNRYPKLCGIHIAKSGLISIYRLAVDKIGIKEGDRIALIQDNDKPDDFYLIKMDNKELPVLRHNSTKRHLQVNYIDAYYAIIDHFKLEKKGYKILMGGAVRTPYGTAWCLITAPLKEMRKEDSNA